MTKAWRALGLAAAILLGAAAVSTAQTVWVTKASPGSTLEVTLNGTKIGSAAVDAKGVASVDVNLSAHGGKKAMDVRIAIESCGDLLRVALAEAGAQAAPTAECSHTDIAGLYVMRDVTSFVVDPSQSTPAIWLRQGAPPKSWLYAEFETQDRNWAPLPKGLILSAGAGLDSFGNATTVFCGDVSSCSSAGRRTLSVGGSFWVTRAFGVDVSYVKPADVTIAGSDTGYRFTTTMQTAVLTVTAKAGVTAGPVRVYGLGGAAYHWTSSTTSETIDGATVTVNGVTTPVAGGTQSSGLNAPGWGWVAGGGLEVWIKSVASLYAEGGFAPLKGNDTRGGEGTLDDHVIYAVGGVRVHVWR